MNTSHDNQTFFTDTEINELRYALLVRFIKEGFGISAGGRKFRPNWEFWHWINTPSDMSPFGFEQTCRALGYNAGYLRYLLITKFNQAKHKR